MCIVILLSFIKPQTGLPSPFETYGMREIYYSLKSIRYSINIVPLHISQLETCKKL